MPSAANRPRATQLRSRKTRQALIDAADRLWTERGFDGTSVGEICEAAGVTVGAFYFHFARKEDLLVELALHGSNRLWTEYLELEEGGLGTADALDRMLTRLGKRWARSPRPLLQRIALELVARSQPTPAETGGRHSFHAVFQTLFTRAVRRGEIDGRVQPEEAATLLTIVVFTSLVQWARDGRGSLVELLRRRARFVLRGAGG